MNYTIHITKNAETDLNQALDYIEFTLLNPQAAENLLDTADEKISSLSCAPQSHKLVEDPILSASGIRFILINSYIAFFIIDEDVKIVHIIRFIHSKRNWIDILKAENPKVC